MRGNWDLKKKSFYAMVYRAYLTSQWIDTIYLIEWVDYCWVQGCLYSIYSWIVGIYRRRARTIDNKGKRGSAMLGVEKVVVFSSI